LKKTTRNIIFYSLLIALPLAVVIGVLLPVKHNRYKAKIINTEYLQHKSKIYVDWDNDNFSEEVRIDKNMVGKASLNVYMHDGSMLDQYDLETELIYDVPRPFADDFDNDGYKELFLLTQNRDSVFLNGFDFNDRSFFTNRQFIDKVPLLEGANDFSCGIRQAFDADNDGIKEILISINAGFSLHPRKLYLFNSITNTIVTTPEIYTKINPHMVFDLDGDGTKEIISNTQATNNTENAADSLNLPFPDSLAWAFVFNADLSFKFPPRSFPGTISQVSLFPVQFENKYRILCLHSNRGQDGPESSLLLLDWQGNELKKTALPKTEQGINHQLIPVDLDFGKFILRLSNGSKYLINAGLNLDRKIKRDEFIATSAPRKIHTSDSTFLYALVNKRKNEIALATPDLKHLVPLGIPALNSRQIISVEKAGETTYLHIHDSEAGYTVLFQKDRLFYLKFFIYPIVYLILTWLTFLVLRTQRRRIEKQYETEKRLSELQFQNIKNQLTPHFTFNVLNSIGRMVRSGESEEAYDYLSKNAKMLRSLMDEANDVTRTLAKEIDFVKDFLALQKLRFKDRYQFNIDLDPTLDLSVKIPKMIIHTYVENALKHGLNDMREGGVLTIKAAKIPHHKILFEISDNGRGMEKLQLSENGGNGLKMMEQYYRLFEEYYGYKIKVSFEKLNPENKVNPGTRVVVLLQLPGIR